MTSKALSNNGFKKQLMWNLKSQKWFIIAFVVLRTVIAALMSMLMCSTSRASGEEMIDSAVVKLLNDVTYSLTSPLVVIDIIIGTLCSFIILNTLFAFLYSKRKTDLYHGFPITRGAYYLAALAVPVIINAVCLVSEFAFISIISKVYSATSFADLGVIFLYELLIFVILAAITGILALSISVSGMVVSYIINAVLILLAAPLAVYVLIMSFESIIPAFANSFENIWALFPYGLLLSQMIGNDISFAVSIPVSIIVAVVSGLFGLYFYRTRKSESSESYPSSNVPFYFGVMGLSTFIGAMIYMIAHNIFIAIAVAVVVSLLIMFIMNLISERRIRKSTVLYWLGFSFVFAGVMLTAKYGTSSYTNRIPEVSQVESVEIDTNVYGYGSANFLDRIFGSAYTQDQSVKLTKEESIKLVNAYHKEALSKINTESANTLYAKLTYTLKDGKTVTRVLPYLFYILENRDDGGLNTKELKIETFEKLQKCEEYVQRQAMPYDSKDLASVYVSLNNRSLLLKNEDAKKFFESYMEDASGNETGERPVIINHTGEIAVDQSVINNNGYDLDVKFVFFTDKATDAAKKAFKDIPLNAYKSLYQSNKMINVLMVSINTASFENIEKILDDKGMFAPAASIDEVNENWKVVIASVEYSSYKDPEFGMREQVYPRTGGSSWSMSEFESKLKSDEAGDLLFKTYVNENYSCDRNYILENAKNFDVDNALNTFRTNQTGYIYYFTNDAEGDSSVSTKMYFAPRIK